MNRLTFRIATRDDMPSVLALFQNLYPDLGWSAAFMRWQYFDNPAGEAKVWVCFEGNILVGSVTAIPHRIWNKDKVVTGYRIQDVVTHPDYRGQSIYRRLSEACYGFLDSDESSVHFTFPNENSDRVFRSSGWRPLGNIPLWTATPSGEKCRAPHRIDCFGDAEEDLWRSQRFGLTGIDKDASYLNWKYTGNPSAIYTCYQSEPSVAYVFKTFQRGSETILHICDVLYSQFDVDILRDVFAFARAQSVSKITTWIAPGDELVATLNGFAYEPITTRAYFIRGDTSDWAIRMGDSDVY